MVSRVGRICCGAMKPQEERGRISDNKKRWEAFMICCLDGCLDSGKRCSVRAEPYFMSREESKIARVANRGRGGNGIRGKGSQRGLRDGTAAEMPL